MEFNEDLLFAFEYSCMQFAKSILPDPPRVCVEDKISVISVTQTKSGSGMSVF